MSKIVVIGGTGHVGGYLVPQLVAAGHQVTNLSRTPEPRYRPDPAWDEVEHVAMDRDALETSGEFGPAVAALGADVVVDMICFTQESAGHLCDALQGRIQQLVHVGTIWVHGHSLTVPSRESDPRAPFGNYGTRKSRIEDDLITGAKSGGVPATVVRPGHIVGPGWAPLNPAGHFNTKVFSQIARGEALQLPNFGMETVHHVHASDVAQMIARSIANPDAAIGEAFNAVSPAAITLRGYAEAIYDWFGQSPNLDFAPFDDWAKAQDPDDAKATGDHIRRSPCHSIEKGRDLLGYAPDYSSVQAVKESVTWLIEDGQVEPA